MKKVNRRMFLVAVLLVLGASAATFAQKASRDSVVCLNRYWLFSIRGGYDFNPNTRGANRFLDEKGGFNLGFGFDHYWKWFGVGADLDFINNESFITIDQNDRYKAPYTGPRWSWDEDAHPLNRLFIGVGPSFRLPASCCPKFTAELNTRIGITRIAGSGATLNLVDVPDNNRRTNTYFVREFNESSALSLKGQLRLTYFFNKVFGLSAGAYYLHNFNVNFSDEVTPLLASHLSKPGKTVEPGIKQGKTDLSSFGIFGGLTFRICAEKRIPLAPVAPPPAKAKVTEYSLVGKVIGKGTNSTVNNAIVKIKNITDKTETAYKTNANGEYTAKLKQNKTYSITASAVDYLDAEPKVIEKDTYAAEKTPSVKHDIYMQKKESAKPTEYTVMGKVMDEDSGKTIGNAVVTVENNTNGTEQNYLTNSFGEYSVALKAYETYTISATAPECLPSEGKKFKKDTYDPSKTSTVENNIYLKRVKKNEAIRLDNVHYDLNKATIRPDARPELDRLVKYLKDNPKIRVEMSSHTDSRGSDAYNQRLSQQRADAVKLYLVEKGIAPSRIKSVGYGETKLLNNCGNGSNCTEEQHQLNRRTEMKVIE